MTTTQTITFGPAVTDYSNAKQSLALFNSTLGTLTSVTISGAFGFTSNLTVTNIAAGQSSGSAKVESAAAFGSDTPTINAVIQNLLDTIGSATVGSATINPAAFDLYGTTQTYSLAAGGTVKLMSNVSTHTNGPITDTNAADLSAFEAAGGGMFNVLFSTATGTNLSNTGGNTSASQVTTATGTVKIVYTYNTKPTNTPEPATLALIGSGVLGIAATRRRRKN